MSRRGEPDAEKIVQRAKKHRDGASVQDTLDGQAVDHYTQAHRIETQGGKDDQPKAIGTGIVGGMVDRRVNIVGARPFIRVLSRGGDTAEQHASDTLEPWLNTIIWLAEGGEEVWSTGVQDQQLIGEAWSKVLPAPQFYNDSEYEELIDRWNRLVEDSEDTAGVKEEIRVYRRDNPTIVWRYVDVRGVFFDRDDRPGLAGVYEFRKIDRDVIESRFLDTVLEGKDKEFEVIEYANDVYVATVLCKTKTFLGEPWKHGMGCNPYVRIKRAPLRNNSQGHTRSGAAYHSREMVHSLDESMTDWRSGMRREAKSPLVYTLIPQIRVNLGIENEKRIEPDKKGNLTLYAHKEYGKEEVARAPTPTVNEQLGQYISLVTMYADKTGAWMPQLLGEGPSGESAVHQASSRQSAITGELEIPHRNLEQGIADVGERFFRCVISLDNDLPEGADAEMRKVVVRAEDTKNKSKEIAVTAADVKKYEPMLRGKITKNLPVNMGANVINARELTDPERPLIDENQAREVFLNDENPAETADKLFQQRIRKAGEDAYVESFAQRAKLIVDEFTGEELAKLAEKAMLMPDAAQQALLSGMGEQGNRLMEMMSRGAANQARTGREQRMSNLGGMNQEEMPVA